MINTERYGHAGFRPIVCDGGPALSKLQRLLMPLPDNMSGAIAGAYELENLAPLLETNANVFFMEFDLGFTDAEQRDFYKAFHGAAEYLRSRGAEAVASIAAGHASNRVADKQHGNCAVTPGGKPVPSWLHGFAMTCWTSGEWRKDVERRIAEAFEHGAAGLCIEPVIFGAAPMQIGAHIIGPIGCACARCRSEFANYAGQGTTALKNFPPKSDDEENFFKYIDWRAGIVADAISQWSIYAKKIKSNCTFAAKLLHPVQVNSKLVFGADPAKILPLLDAALVETPNQVNLDKSGLTYNSATMEIMRRIAPECAIAFDVWHAGPHIEFEQPAALMRATMTEAVSMLAAPAVRASLLIDKEKLTPKTLAHESFARHRQAAGALWNWVDRNSEVFEYAEPHAAAALLYQRQSLLRHWSETAPRFFKTYVTLTELHVPFVLAAEDEIGGFCENGVRLLIIPSPENLTESEVQGIQSFSSSGGKLLFLGGAPGWAPEDNKAVIDAKIFEEPLPSIARNPTWRAMVNARHSGTLAPYFQHRQPARGPIAKLMREPGRFLVPQDWKEIFEPVKSMISGADGYVEIEGPPYLLARELLCGGARCFHIANILPGFPGPKMMRLSFPAPVSARILSPDTAKITYTQDRSIVLEVETYSVVAVRGGKKE